MPITRKDEDMPKWGWRKALTYEKLDVRRNRIYVTEADFDVDNLICRHCKNNEFLWVGVPSTKESYATGVFQACSYCGRVNGPLSLDFAPYKRTREVDIAEMLEICERTGHAIPSQAINAVKEYQVRKHRTARRPRKRRAKKIGTK